MPSGNTHDTVTVVTTPIIGVLGYAVTKDLLTTSILSSSYFFSGFMFSGDLDTRSVQYKRWYFLRFIWKPYQKMFSHRSIMTHGTLEGTLVRILYLLSVILLSVWLLTFIPNFPITTIELKTFLIDLITKYPKESISLLIGLLIGSFSHTATDLLVSKHNKMKKKREKKKKKRKTRRKKTRR